jgi:hypothetical protein
VARNAASLAKLRGQQRSDHVDADLDLGRSGRLLLRRPERRLIMAGFQSPIDICNRMLDHCGGRAITGFPPNDNSRNAAKCQEVYDKLRQAELRRNQWVFSTRKVALRPIDTTTMLFIPAAWGKGVQYEQGDIVSYLTGIYIYVAHGDGSPPVDGNGFLNPLCDNYYGPMTVDTWVDPNSTSTTTLPSPSDYHAGEIVYLAAGDGTYTLFLSLVDNNTDDPLAPDLWSPTIMYQKGQIIMVDTVSAAQIVIEGESIVVERGEILVDNPLLYESLIDLNIGNDPYFTVGKSLWLVGTAYTAGTYVFGSDNQIYQAVINNTGNNPTTDNGTNWLSTGMWANTWTTTLSTFPRSTSNQWRVIAGTLSPLFLIFPIGSGPLSQPQTKNLFMLPNNFLMRATPESQLGNKLSFGGAMRPTPEDMVFQGNFFISESLFPVVMRFISDFQNVALMDSMFCEGFAARGGWELCEPLTQKPELRNACATAYNIQMGAARKVNAIEIGPIQEVEDEYLRVRY